MATSLLRPRAHVSISHFRSGLPTAFAVPRFLQPT